MGRQRIEMTGRKFGILVVLHYVGNRMWMCRCECGVEKPIHGGQLRRGDAYSCGCFRKGIHTTHGDAGSRPSDRSTEYNAWLNMLQRCENPNHPEYKNYGARGIVVCDRWHYFENFLADIGRKPKPELSIERVNNDGNYEKDNCRWATKSAQNKNRRSRRK